MGVDSIQPRPILPEVISLSGSSNEVAYENSLTAVYAAAVDSRSYLVKLGRHEHSEVALIPSAQGNSAGSHQGLLFRSFCNDKFTSPSPQ